MKVYDIDSLPLMKVCKDENGKYFVTGGVTYNYEPIQINYSDRNTVILIKKLRHVRNDIKQRCYNPNKSNYKWYGAKGVTVCDEWSGNKSEAFINWALSNGYREGLEIDRIDGNGNYEPRNCRWVTKYENIKNITRRVKMTLNDVTVTAK